MTALVGQSDITAFTDTGVVSGMPTSCIYNPFTATATGTATSLFIYLLLGGFVNQCKLFIANSSKTILASTSAISPSADGWYSSSIASTAITSGITYYLGAYFNNNDGTSGHWGGNPNAFGVFYDTTSGSYASLPASVAGSIDTGVESFAIYADGSTPAVIVPHTFRPFWTFS